MPIGSSSAHAASTLDVELAGVVVGGHALGALALALGLVLGHDGLDVVGVLLVLEDRLIPARGGTYTCKSERSCRTRVGAAGQLQKRCAQ